MLSHIGGIKESLQCIVDRCLGDKSQRLERLEGLLGLIGCIPFNPFI